MLRAENQLQTDVRQTKKDATVRAKERIKVETIKEKIYVETIKMQLDPSCRISDDGVRALNELIDQTNSTIWGPDDVRKPHAPIVPAASGSHAYVN